jgi:hypothetical protein
MGNEWVMPTHCFDCGCYLAGGATVHKQDCSVLKLINEFKGEMMKEEPKSAVEPLMAMQQINDEMNEVTDAMILRYGAKLDPPKKGETLLGTIHSERARRLYCASQRIIAKAGEMKLRCDTVAASDEEETELAGEASRLLTLSEIIKKLWWLEARIEMNHFQGDISIRKDYMIVGSVESSGSEVPSVIRKLFGLD